MKVKQFFLLVTAFSLTAQLFAGVAITEFINNVNGNEDSNEWIEVFNYGPTPATVDLSQMYISDNGFQTQQITDTSYILSVGNYAVLTFYKEAFTNNWQTVDEGKVVQMSGDSFNLANSDDQIILYDANSNQIWNLGYPNGESAGNATWLATNKTWGVTDYGYDGGVGSGPLIDREGEDTPVGAGLGYENNNATTDPNVFTSDIDGDIGSPGTGSYTAIPEPAFLAILSLIGFAFLRK